MGFFLYERRAYTKNSRVDSPKRALEGSHQSWPSYGAPCQALKKRFPTEGVDPEERFNNPRSSHSTFDLPVAYAKRGSPNIRVTSSHLTIAAFWNQSSPKNRNCTWPLRKSHSRYIVRQFRTNIIRPISSSPDATS